MRLCARNREIASGAAAKLGLNRVGANALQAYEVRAI
jgi:hypothetical protein